MLETIEAGRRLKPPRIIIYGPRGVGKTSFAAQAPDPIFIQTEDGLGLLEVPAFPLATTFPDVLAAILALYKGEHHYKTVVIDSLDWCERLIHDQVRKENGDKIFTDYGKGYVYAVPLFERMIAGLDALRNKKGMTVIVVAHSLVKRYESPEVEPYDRYCLDLHQKASSMWEEWCDCLLFANQRVYTTSTDTGFGRKAVRGVGSGERVIYTEERPSHVAKNRYRLPPELPLEPDRGWEALMEAVAKSTSTK